ncbi:hypothetical protein LJC20_03695 [Eubacteriales bacterium OttesenSCG-928-M02]|nr:hypothetical protein [Eubacteriales bacterium OttesenSCG-928-M02]
MSGFVIDTGDNKGLPNNLLEGDGSFAFYGGIGGYQQITDFSELSLKTLNDQLEKLWGGRQMRQSGGGDYSTTALLMDAELSRPRFSGRSLVGEKKETYYVATNGNDSRDGRTEETAFRTVMRALGQLPIVLKEGATIHVKSINGGQLQEAIRMTGPLIGDVEIVFETPIPLIGCIEIGPGVQGTIGFTNVQLQGTEKMGVRNSATGGTLVLTNCDIVMNNPQNATGVGTEGGRTFLTGCCITGGGKSAITASKMGQVGVYNCTGTGNGIGLLAETGGMITATGTSPSGGQGMKEETGGRIQSTATPTIQQRILGQGYQTVEFFSTATFCALDRTFIADTNPSQGQDNATKKLYKGYWRFDGLEIEEALLGKTIVGGRFFLKRKAGVGKKDRVKAYLYSHGHEGPWDSIATVNNPLGELYAVSPEETAGITVSIAAIARMQTGASKGFAVHSPEEAAAMEFYGQAEYPARLWVAYR